MQRYSMFTVSLTASANYHWFASWTLGNRRSGPLLPSGDIIIMLPIEILSCPGFLLSAPIEAPESRKLRPRLVLSYRKSICLVQNSGPLVSQMLRIIPAVLFILLNLIILEVRTDKFLSFDKIIIRREFLIIRDNLIKFSAKISF